MTGSDRIELPDFNKIVKEASFLLIQNHVEKENSWIGLENENFWKNKLKEELKEVLGSMDRNDDAKYTQKELLDLINVASMLYHNLGSV